MAQRLKQKAKAKAKAKASVIPDRIVGPDSGIDSAALLAELTELALAGGDVRNGALAVLKSSLSDAMEHAKKLFEFGRLGGLEMARMIAAIHDDIVTVLFDFTLLHVTPAANPTQAERMALCAVGGYGRGEMAPQSDLDLLFLIANKKGSPHTEALTEYMLYMLWDLGLKVGHSTRTVDQCVKLAKEDQTILTSLLDIRFLRGDAGLADGLYKKFQSSVKRGRGRKYISEKLAERDERHDREGNSRYVIEPNVKEGKGGLRDLHVLYWIARFLDKKGQITDPQLGHDYVDMGLFNKAAAKRFTHAADFLWRTRIWLHFTANRATETLSFDKQVEICRKMGYASGPVEVAVEGFMREYFTNAREVGALTRIACAKLEEEKSILLPKGLETYLPGSRRNLKNPNLVLDHGRLMFSDPMNIRNDPSIILQLFETAGRRNLDIHPDAFSAIDFRRNVIDADFRRNPKNSKLFQKLLLSAKAPYATLKAMNEAGVLGRYLTEFGGIVGRTQFNMHHAFTVDEHTLRLIDHFDNLRKDRMAEAVPIGTEIAKNFDKTEMLTIFLTCLLHDTGKGQGDQCIEGAQLARRACRRLGVSQSMTDTVAWLVRRHLDMSETAQRRDISDPETISKFGELVGSLERLQLLYVLTIVDIHAVELGDLE
ncbi:[protein-PII] uridylyltransferase [Litorimonas sp. RW-G-Af-16]|uniref:[protein-PII] uridylyltransferase n=1 Tax=Litorimonas sp. RW-G-Af-16 TaxID=3241168 RepID=UPI003AAC24C9